METQSINQRKFMIQMTKLYRFNFLLRIQKNWFKLHGEMHALH